MRSNIVASQHADPSRVGRRRPRAGVAAARPGHLRRRRSGAGRRASVTIADIAAVAVTQGPGLVGSLLVGVAFAKSLAWARGIPVVPVHHLAGHIESLTLAHGELPLPAAMLVVSGGHTSLYFIDRPGQYRLIGRTRDDAAGEAYDKVAKLLGLGYPGGPAIDRIAQSGNDRAFDFPRRPADACGSERTARDRRRRSCRRHRAARRLQLQRAEDRRAAPRSRPDRHGRPAASRPAPPTPRARRCRRRRSRTSRQLPARGRRARCSIARSRPPAGSARAASASPAACRRTAACAPTRASAASGTAFPFRSAALAVDGQRGDDRRRGAAAVPPRGAGGFDFNAEASLPLDETTSDERADGSCFYSFR